MTPQEVRQRNWLKFRLMGLIGFSISGDATTEEEKDLLFQIIAAKRDLLDNWEENSEKLGLVVKPYKCEHIGCRRRSNIPHEYEGENYCLKHYKKMIKNDISNRIPISNSSMDNIMVRNVDGSTTSGSSNYSDNGQ